MLTVLLILGLAKETHLIGRSMEQYGLHDGGTAIVYKTDDVEPGQLVQFKCRSGCPAITMIKLLVYEKDGCYWFQGNDNEWLENGEWRKSVDSREYGLACDVEIMGYVL